MRLAYGAAPRAPISSFRADLTCRSRVLNLMRKVPISLPLCVLLLAALVLSPFLFAGTETLSELRMRKTVTPRFTLDQAVLTALQRNADIQKARQDIERTKGLYIQMRAEILPKIEATTEVQNTDPHLGSISSSSGGG